MRLKFWEKPTKSQQAKVIAVSVLHWIVGKPEPKKWWELKK